MDLRLSPGPAAILLASLTVPVFCSASLPQPFTALYGGSKKIFVFDVEAQASLRLERSGEYLRYSSRSEIRWSFYQRQFYDCSVLRIDNGKLYPVEYLHTDSGDDKYRVATTFDWQSGKAVTIRGDKPEPREVPLQWPTWDALSAQVAIIDAAPRQQPDSVIHAGVVERGKLAHYALHFKGEATTDTHISDIRVVKVVSAKDDSSKILWLAPDYHWVPVKIEVDEVVLQLLQLPTIDAVDDTGRRDISRC